ncbi:MAG: phage minor head protein, partial [Ignavibacteriae bacterium]|nr:phage minor head protein [Ignavibacteriota bacterium]
MGVPPRAWLKTNLQTAVTGAFHSAQRTRLQDPGLAGLYPAWKYMTRMDGAVRPEHMALQGKVYYANDPIWSVIYPPNGWNCRCYVMPLSDYELKADNITPEELQSTKTPERKALIKEADINPDFINNPDSIWGKWLKDKFKDMPPHVVYDINRKAEDKFKTSGDSGSLSKDKTPPLDYEKHIDSTEKSLLRGCEIRYKEKPSNQPGSTEISYDFKTAKVELSESAVDKPATFKHEIGHIVSVVNGNLHLTKDFR